MTYYVLILFCVIILLAYIFDITSRYTKIPGVILLIVTGMALNHLAVLFRVNIPDMSGLLPVMGTLGLILIVLEGALDLSISRDKTRLIISSVSSALMLMMIFTGLFTFIAVYFFGYDLKAVIINVLPLAVISSAIAIPAATHLNPANREFVTYESSLSDIIGIVAFDFILLKSGPFGSGALRFLGELTGTLAASVLFSIALAVMLHKISHHVKYVIIMTVIVLMYALAKLIHLPSLVAVLIFGLVMNNNRLFQNRFTTPIINFKEFNTDLGGFKNIAAELTFIIRSFFFIIFGYQTSVSDLLNLKNLIISFSIAASVLILRALFFKAILRMPLEPLVFFAPRGLITILLFLSIPPTLLLPFMNVGVVTQVIFITIVIMTLGNMFFKDEENKAPPDAETAITNEAQATVEPQETTALVKN